MGFSAGAFGSHGLKGMNEKIWQPDGQVSLESSAVVVRHHLCHTASTGVAKTSSGQRGAFQLEVEAAFA